MKKLAASLLALLFLATSAFAQNTKTQITTDINTQWPDNVIGAITPAKLRTVVQELVNSYWDPVSPGQTTPGYIAVGSASGALVGVQMSGSCTMTATGSITCSGAGGAGIPTTASGTANAIVLTPVTGSPPSVLTNFLSYIFQATASNNAATTVKIGALGPYTVYRDGPLGPVPTIGKEIVSGNWYTVGFDSTLNGGTGGWHLGPGLSSAASLPANCTSFWPVSFNSPLQSAFTPSEGGASGGSGIASGSGGYQLPCMRGNLEWWTDNFHQTGTDATGINQITTVTGAADNGAGRIRLTVVSTASLTTGQNYGISSVYGCYECNGYFTITVIDATHIDLNNSTYNPAHPWVAGGFNLVTNGALDVNPYIDMGRIVLCPTGTTGCVTRTPQYSDYIGMLLYSAPSVQHPTSNAPYMAMIGWIIDPDETYAEAHGALCPGTTTGTGRGNFAPSLCVMQGVVGTGPGYLLPLDLPGTQVNWKAADKGYGVMSMPIGYYAYNMPIGAPNVESVKNMSIARNAGTPNTKIDLTFDSIALGGPVATFGAFYRTTIPVTTTATQSPQSIDFTCSAGPGCLDTGAIAANTDYALYIIKNPATGGVNALASTNFTTPTLPSGFTVYGYAGNARTGSGSTLLPFVIQQSSRQGLNKMLTVAEATTLTNPLCFTTVSAGGAASYTLTINAASGYAAQCWLRITNTDAAQTKTVSPNGLSSMTLQPLQSIVVRNEGFPGTATWYYDPHVLPTPVTAGGTGVATVAQGDLLYGSASNTLSALAKDTNATRYLSNTGGSNNPAWAQVNLTNGVTGTLPLGNGGTGQTSLAAVAGALVPVMINTTITGVNFNSANTDNAIVISMPTGYTRMRPIGIEIAHASASLTTSTFGLFTTTGGGGTALIPAGAANTVSTASENTANNGMFAGVTPVNTMTLQPSSLPTLNTIYFRVGTPQGSAATADVTFIYTVVP